MLNSTHWTMPDGIGLHRDALQTTHYRAIPTIMYYTLHIKPISDHSIVHYAYAYMHSFGREKCAYMLLTNVIHYVQNTASTGFI